MRWTEREKGREAGRETDREKVTEGERETESDVPPSREWTLVDTVTLTHTLLHARTSSLEKGERKKKKASRPMMSQNRISLKMMQIRANAGDLLINWSNIQINEWCKS